MRNSGPTTIVKRRGEVFDLSVHGLTHKSARSLLRALRKLEPETVDLTITGDPGTSMLLREIERIAARSLPRAKPEAE